MTAPAGDEGGRSRGTWLDLLQPVLLLVLDLLHWRMAGHVLHAQDQLRQLIDALLYAALACVLLAVGLLSAIAGLLLWVEPAYRALTLGLIAAGCVTTSSLFLRWLRRRVRQHLSAAPTRS